MDQEFCKKLILDYSLNYINALLGISKHIIQYIEN